MAVKTLKLGDKGRQVKDLQGMLNDAKCGIKLKADGEFDSEMEDAVKEFQKQNGIKANGVADDELFNIMGTTTQIEISDEQGNSMVIEVTTGLLVKNTWKTVKGSLDAVNASSGAAIEGSRSLTLVKLGELHNFQRKVGTKGEGTFSPGDTGFTWKILSVE